MSHKIQQVRPLHTDDTPLEPSQRKLSNGAINTLSISILKSGSRVLLVI